MSSTFSTGPLAFVLILTAIAASWVFDWFEQAFREFLNDRGDAFADAYGDIPALPELRAVRDFAEGGKSGQVAGRPETLRGDIAHRGDGL